LRRLRVSGRARRDFQDILGWSERQFGLAARARYRLLVETAFQELAEDPERHGTRELPSELGPGQRVYHLKWSRRRAFLRGGGVRTPRHIVVYRPSPDEIVVVRLLHDAMALSEALKRNGKPDE
jgi:toxin ParE1/3/4